MHVLFVHQNFPAQFGHIARHLIRTRGWTCTFVSKTPAGKVDGIEKVAYTTTGGARETTHYCSRTFENAVWHAHGVYEACKARPDLRPDLIVGHSGFGSTVYLPELYPDVPIINYFEFYYHSHQSDMDFRPEFPPSELDFLRARSRNAMLLLDLETCRRGYSPTRFQQTRFPEIYQPKIDVIFDGIETDIFQRRQGVPRKIGDRIIPPTTRVVTYVSRGFEAMRGFDIFMRVAKRIYEQFPDVVFAVVGSDRICYGGDEKHIEHRTFREHVMAQAAYDRDKFIFTGLLGVSKLVDLWSISDLASLFHRSVRLELVDGGCARLRLHGARVGYRASARDDRRRPERAPLRFLRRRGFCSESGRGAARSRGVPAPGRDGRRARARRLCH